MKRTRIKKSKNRKSRIIKAIKKEVLVEKKNIANTCGEQDCSETNCSNYCGVPPHQDVSV